jgi:hypothetical protein
VKFEAAYGGAIEHLGAFARQYMEVFESALRPNRQFGSVPGFVAVLTASSARRWAAVIASRATAGTFVETGRSARVGQTALNTCRKVRL